MNKEGTLRQAAKVLELISQKGVESDRLQRLLSSGLLSDVLDAEPIFVDRNAFRKILSIGPPDGIYAITIRYNWPLKRMIAAGHFGLVSDQILTYNKTGVGIVEKEVRLIELPEGGKIDDAGELADRLRMRLVNLCELLALGAQYRILGREFPIAGAKCLNDPFGDKNIPIISHGNNGKRHLYGTFDNGFVKEMRYACVPKEI